jgi:hypothetical protein
MAKFGPDFPLKFFCTGKNNIFQGPKQWLG